MKMAINHGRHRMHLKAGTLKFNPISSFTNNKQFLSNQLLNIKYVNEK